VKLHALIVIIATAFVTVTYGQIEVPVLRDRQFVYTIPENFNPPMIQQFGVNELNNAARQCHYPFYVVLVETLPAGSESDDERAAVAINQLAQQWADRYPSFDIAKSQIFLLSYEPRKYRFLAGSKFESELGFEKEAHRPYTAIFDRSVKNQRKDPKAGIINMMTAVDDYLFDQTDPVRIAARKEAVRSWYALLSEIAKYGTAIIAFLILAILGVERRQKLVWLREEFNTALTSYRNMVTNAAQQYFRMYGNRGDILALTNVKGETAMLYAAVTKEVDSIYVGVEALRSHADKCKSLADKTTFFNLKPLDQAVCMLDEEFEFDTGDINKESLFEPETKIIKINPQDLARSLTERFKQTVKGWDRLKAAIAARTKPAEEHFPSAKLDELVKLADEYKIPRRWLNDHPLFDNEMSDKTLYESINALSWEDPVAYVQRLAEIQTIETSIEERLHHLVVAVQLTGLNRLEAEPTIGETTVDPKDDPRITFNLARQAENKLAGVLESAKTVEEVEAQAKKIDDLYRQTADQAATIKAAVKGAEDSIKKAVGDKAHAKSQLKEANQRVIDAQKIHKEVATDTFLKSAAAYLAEGVKDLEKAKRQIGDKRHLNARNNADLASEQFTQSLKQSKQVTDHCDMLDQKKIEYENQLVKMDELRSNYQRRLKKYRGSQTLDTFQLPSSKFLLNYVLLLAALYRQQNAWESEVQQAQRAYEEAERQWRQAEERQRRQEEEEEASRQQSSYSSSSYDSGGSWDSGSDSSSGGSWGGGGDSSSGGSW